MSFAILVFYVYTSAGSINLGVSKLIDNDTHTSNAQVYIIIRDYGLRVINFMLSGFIAYNIVLKGRFSTLRLPT